MGSLQGVGLEFEETMTGWVGIGKKDYVGGRIAGQKESGSARMDMKIIIEDLDFFINISNHYARLEGVFTFYPLGGAFVIRDGRFNLFTIDPASGVRQMTYSFLFTGGDGRDYYFHGHKEIKSDSSSGAIEDMTTLFSDIYQGTDEHAPLYGKGQIFFALQDSVGLMASMKVTGTARLDRTIQAKLAFMSFAWGIIRQEYLRDVNPLYDTEYENLVLSGKLLLNGEARDFFLVSGVHERDFPWGDGEMFWDVLLAVGDATGGYRRYAITDRVLEGLELNVGEGTYRYAGPIFELTDGYATSFSDIRNRKAGLVEWRADFSIRFRAAPYDITPFPFPVANDVLAKMASGLKWALRSILPSEPVLGIFITPHTVTVDSGSLHIKSGGETAEYTMDTSTTFGEAERTTMRNIKTPALLYGYICALRPDERAARVQIHANSLRDERQRLLKDQVEAGLGALISRVASSEMLMEREKLTVRNLWPKEDASGDRVRLFLKVGEPILEVNNDQFPTAVFQRRIIRVEDPSGAKCLALEEDMDLMRLEAENSSKEVVVASVRNPDKFAALDAVLEKTGFLDVVANRLNDSGKAKAEFSIVIKPNFMFSYNKCDRTSYTDPELVEHLVRVLGGAGYPDITVVEAQSTYGQYFDNRRVLEVAQYLGFSTDGRKGYKMIDLTEDQNEREYLGPYLGTHPVPLTWKKADLRISFAKNKTHAYAYYTLTLKNIYGALPLADKFLEYHTSRDIYHTTMEYLQAYPVHYGLIDAHLSADGPFGVFADSEPNVTETILGGEDLVAVDWVGASKMGIQPKISEYMELAVKTFGKPEIKLIGDSNPYRPWLNVPAVLSMFTNFGLDSNHYFGNLIYMALAYMDESHFTCKSGDPFMRAARMALRPLQTAVFLQAGGERTLANRLVGRFERWLGSH